MPAANPQPIALVVCENIYFDSAGKRALVGLFNRISTSVPDGPITQRRMCVYVSMTEVYAGTVIRLEIVNGETDVRVVVAESPPAPSSTNPRSIFDFQFEFQNLQFPEPGLYFVRFFGNDHPLLERPIEVIRMNGGEEGDDSHDDD